MMTVVATIGEKLKRLREARAWTQVELAEKANTSPSTIVLIEKGMSKPHPSTRRKLASALGVEPADLLED